MRANRANLKQVQLQMLKQLEAQLSATQLHQQKVYKSFDHCTFLLVFTQKEYDL